MGSLNPDAESKQELDDSGYVQDETASKQAAEEYIGTAQLLDLSDDVLLYILRYCSPQDLKALGFSCPRLGAIVLDRTLWVDVDAGATRHGRRRVRWLLAQALGPHTRRLRLGGYAREAEGCLGFVNRYDLPNSNDGAPGSWPPEEERYLCGGPRVYRLTQTLPRYGGGFPYWPHAGSGPAVPPQPAPGADTPAAADGCPGPQLTLTHTGLRELSALCTALTTLELEHCVIDCQTTNIGMFPKTLTKLSLKGTKCFNLESKSFLFKIQDHLTHLEELDVSYCSWIEPACMLPLSKMPCLRTLAMRECHKLAEFVAYASLATRYGFKKLKYLDLRGSPVGDSEVSALGWLPSLEELYLSPSPAQPRIKEHAHYSQDLLPAHTELEEWEETEPDYFKSPEIPEDEWVRDEENVRGNRTRYYTTNSDDPSACILLERMIAEPVAPEEYSQVYHQFLAGHNSNIPLANPEEYREAYRQYMARPNHAHPPAGYSLFIRKPEDDRRQASDEPTPAKRRKQDHAEPGTSKERDVKPSTSAEAPGPSNVVPPRGELKDPRKGKRDLEDSSDDDSPPSKRACAEPSSSGCLSDDNVKKDSKGVKKSTTKKDDSKKKHKVKLFKLPSRVFEITINELNAVELLISPDVPNNGANDANNGADNANNGAENANNGADNANNGADNANNGADNAINELNNVNKESDVKNKTNNVNNEGDDANIRTDNDDGNVNNGVKNVENEEENIDNGADNVKKESNAYNKTNNVSNEADNVNEDDNGNIQVNVNKEGNNVIIRTDNVSNEADNVSNEADNVSNEADNVHNEDDNVNNEDDHVNNNCDNDSNVTSEPKNIGNEPNNANNEPNNANPDRGHVRRAIFESINNIFNNEPIVNNEPVVEYPAGNNDNNGAPISRSQRLFQFRQYRRPIVIEEFVNACEEPIGARRLPRGVLFSGGNLPGGPTRLDHSALVSDSSIRRFGRAIGENINYIHIGGAVIDANARPDRSSLRVLSVTGFRRVTDASLTHLATAAPQLRSLDVSRTAVTRAALAAFRALRPDVTVTCDPDAA